jgi:Tfp pilus assembly protein PilO
MKYLDRICLAIIVIVVIVGGYGVFRFSGSQRDQIRHENDLLAQRLGNLRLATTNLERLRGILDDTRQELNLLNERIPESAKLGDFLNQLDTLLKNQKMSLVSLQPQAIVNEKHYKKIPVRLMLNGLFLDIHRFLHDLELIRRVLVTEKIVITKTNVPHECQVDLTISIFERQ